MPLPFSGKVFVSVAALFAAGVASAQDSPPAQASIAIGGKNISIRYSAPSVRGRPIFGANGLLTQDSTYPVWRAGANDATALHTDADLTIGGLAVPKGDYTLYCLVKNPDAWQLIINKETGQSGLSYDPKRDLGRVKMTMTKPPAPIETMKFTLTSQGPKQGKLELAWERHIGSVPITVK